MNSCSARTDVLTDEMKAKLFYYLASIIQYKNCLLVAGAIIVNPQFVITGVNVSPKKNEIHYGNYKLSFR